MPTYRVIITYTGYTSLDVVAASEQSAIDWVEANMDTIEIDEYEVDTINATKEL